MDTILSHRDRELVKESLFSIPIEDSEKDSDLIQNLSIYLKENPPFNAASRSYHQFSVDLINYLRRNPDNEHSDLVRRVLKFLSPFYLSELNLTTPAVKTFVAGFVLHEISCDGNFLISSEINSLTKEEKINAEDLLFEFSNSSLKNDRELIQYSNEFLSNLGKIEFTTLIQRFRRNIIRLSRVLSDQNEGTEENKSWARGALSYLFLKGDVIPDNLGILGLLDDIYIAKTAVQLIDPSTQPLEDLIDDLYSTWPFLRDLVLDHCGREYFFSEFALVNTALSCHELIDAENSLSTALVLSSSGITPFTIAFGSALGMAYEASKILKEDIPQFEIGNKVKVDNAAIAIYDGIDEISGLKYIRLKQYVKHKGKELETISRIPVNQSGRLCAAPVDSKLKGSIPTEIKYTEKPVTATESLFHIPHSQPFTNHNACVWLVSQNLAIHKLATETTIYKQPLYNVVPIGHIKRDGKTDFWGSHFGEAQRLLTIISDLDLASEVLDEADLSDNDLIVVDLSGINRNKTASLQLIKTLGARIFCIVEEKDFDTVEILKEAGFNFWEWSEKEITEFIFLDKNYLKTNKHPFNKNDSLTLSSYCLTPKVTELNFEPAVRANISINKLTRYISNKDDEVPDELNSIVDQLLEVMFLFIRTPVPAAYLSKAIDDKVAILDQISQSSKNSFYISDFEKQLINNSTDALLECYCELNTENKKHLTITGILKDHPSSKVLVSPWMLSNLDLTESDNLLIETMTTWKDINNNDSELLIVPFWPGEKRAWEIFSAPPAKEIHFILYPFENNWRLSFERKRYKAKCSRMKINNRDKIFSKPYAWKSVQFIHNPKFPTDYEPGDSYLIEERSIRQKHRLLSKAKRNGGLENTKAKLVIFRGGAFTFFTPGHDIWSATHLLSEESLKQSDNHQVTAVKVNDLKENDVLVFLRGSDRDAIRALADEKLTPGTRDISSLWQTVLRNYVSTSGTSISDLQKQLKDAGCKRHIVTIRHWLKSETIIGPRNYNDGDLDAIVKITGDSFFEARKDECSEAIADVWSEHLRASNTLAQKVLEGVSEKLIQNFNLGSPIDISDGLSLVQVEYVDSDLVEIPVSSVNRLMEEF